MNAGRLRALGVRVDWLFVYGIEMSGEHSELLSSNNEG